MTTALICYIALTAVATAMANENGQGLMGDPVRTLFTGAIGAMGWGTLPLVVEVTAGSFWADCTFWLMSVIGIITVAIYVMSPRIVERSLAKMLQERDESEAEQLRIAALRPENFAGTWVPELKDAVVEAVAVMDRFMERTSDTYDQNAMDVRILIGHVPEIVRLACEAIAKQDEAFRAYTARQAIDRIIAMSRFVERAAMQLRTSEDDALESRLRYVDQRIDETFSAFA